MSLGERVSRLVLAYGLWFVSSIMAAFTAFYLRATIIQTAFGKINPWQLRALDNWGTVVIGGLCLVFVIGAESFFRHHLLDQVRSRPIRNLLIIQVVVLAISRFLALTT